MCRVYGNIYSDDDHRENCGDNTISKADLTTWLEGKGATVDQVSYGDGHYCISFEYDDYDRYIEIKDEDIKEYSFEDIVEEADMWSCCGDVLDQDTMRCPSCKENN